MADEEEARGLTVARTGLANAPAQLRAVRKDGWTTARRRKFMETLATTCNVTEAARAAEKSSSSAYEQKRRDPAFAREWAQALSIGYAELEALLLRQTLFGSEQEDIVLDSDGAVKSRKIRRGVPLQVGVRLLLAHRNTVAALRAEEMRDRPDGEDALARMRRVLEEVRQRRRAHGEGGD